MKKTIYSLIFIGFALIFTNWIIDSMQFENLATFYFVGVLLYLTFGLIGVSIYYALFKFYSGPYYIKAGKHYSKGPFFPYKFFFFKKKFEFEYMIEERLQQRDAGQVNKIAGITSILYRRNSVRIGYKNTNKRGLYYQYLYQYNKGERIERVQGARKFNKFYYAYVEAPRMIWFGVYHKPYHGGKIASSKNGRIWVKEI